MSLITRLWIALTGITLAALVTAATVNLVSSQRYLENELRIKNLDVANALALTISQSASDDVMAGLLLSSQFDLGHYRRIDFYAPNGQLLLERERAALDPGVTGRRRAQGLLARPVRARLMCLGLRLRGPVLLQPQL